MKSINFVHVTIAAIACLIIGTVVGYFIGMNPIEPPARAISNFEECAAAGNPVMESYPRQCRANGVLYVEQVMVPPMPPDDRPMPVEPDGSIGDGATGCVPAGCSGQVCAELSEASNIVTTCEYRAEYACYALTKCERQASGLCGWTQTSEFTSCLSNPPPIQ